MQQNPGTLALQCDLLALGAMLEATRGGDAGHELMKQAARLQSLSRQLQRRDDLPADGANEGDPLHCIEQRLASVASQQHDLAALANEIETRAQRKTCALQFEDVESRVVVYSKQHAQELREQLARIEQMGKALQAGIAADRDEIASIANTIKHQSGKRRAQASKTACTDGQNRLDRDDGEMF